MTSVTVDDVTSIVAVPLEERCCHGNCENRARPNFILCDDHIGRLTASEIRTAQAVYSQRDFERQHGRLPRQADTCVWDDECRNTASKQPDLGCFCKEHYDNYMLDTSQPLLTTEWRAVKARWLSQGGDPKTDPFTWTT